MSEGPLKEKRKVETDFTDLEMKDGVYQENKESVASAPQDIQPEQPDKPIVGSDDAWIKGRLDKIDTLNFKPGFSPEEYFNETPPAKETVNDTPVDAVLAKIAAEKKLTGAMFLNYLNDMGGTSAPPEAIEKIMIEASKRLDKDVFEKLQTIVLLPHVHEPEIHKEKANLEPNQVDDKKVHDEVKNVEAPKVPENLPHGSEDELKKFEKGLTKSVENWQKGRKDVESPEEWKPTTRAEWKEEMRSIIFGEKTSEGKREHVENSKAYLAKRSEELGEKAKGYGPKAAEAIGSVVERYNKLHWKTKIAITSALMLGVAYMPVAAGAFTAALYGQRAIGAIGMGMNKRKKLDAKIAANPEHWLAGKSELAKNAYVTLLSTGYMAATSVAVHEGVEWLGTILGHDSMQHDVTPAAEGPAALAPSTDALENLAPRPEVSSGPLPDVKSIYYEDRSPADTVAPDSNPIPLEAQENILNAMPDGSETPIHTQAEWDVLAMDNKMHVLADALARSEAGTLSPVETDILNTNLDKLTPEQLKTVDTYLQNIPGDAYIDQDEALRRIIEKQQQLGGQSTEAPFGLDPIDGHPMSELESQKLAELRNAMHDPRETGAWPPKPPEEKGFFETLFGSSDENPTETAGQFSVDSVSATEPHIYADPENHLFAYGGTPEEKIKAISDFLTQNPDKIIFGSDDNGNYRIPWYLSEGHPLPGDPVRTGGFFGFGSHLMDAPKPEEFVNMLK